MSFYFEPYVPYNLDVSSWYAPSYREYIGWVMSRKHYGYRHRKSRRRHR